MSVEVQKAESTNQPTQTQSQQAQSAEKKVLTVELVGEEKEEEEDDHACPNCNSPIIVSSTEPFECGKCQAQFDPTVTMAALALFTDRASPSSVSLNKRRNRVPSVVLNNLHARSPSSAILTAKVVSEMAAQLEASHLDMGGSASSVSSSTTSSTTTAKPIPTSASSSTASSTLSSSYTSSSYTSPSYTGLLLESKRETTHLSSSLSMSASSSSPLSDSTDDQLIFGDSGRSASSSISSTSSQLPLAPGVFVRIERKEEKAARKDAKKFAPTSSITSPYQMSINPMLQGAPAASMQSNPQRKHDYGIIMDIRQGFVKVNVVTEVQNKQGSVKYNSKWIPVEHVSEVDPREFTNKTKH